MRRRRTPFNRREKSERKKHLYRALPLFFRRHPPCARVCVCPPHKESKDLTSYYCVPPTIQISASFTSSDSPIIDVRTRLVFWRVSSENTLPQPSQVAFAPSHRIQPEIPVLSELDSYSYSFIALIAQRRPSISVFAAVLHGNSTSAPVLVSRRVARLKPRHQRRLA
ncbi:hypothetical protein FALCPG4_004478 [Fusarium falciforme]